jgi:glutamate-1-semialdehyde 2,1-aminomutase
VNCLRSQQAFDRARGVLVGGVNSPVRSFRGVGGTPRFIERAEGCRIWDLDGHELIDFVGSWGPLILGHAHPEVVAAIREAAGRGTSFGAPTELESEVAELITGALPSVERVRMTNSGTEACLTAIRLARGVTGRPKIVKMIGCYHGHVDALLVKAGSGALTLGEPDSAGVTPGAVGDTLLVHFNDLDALARVFEENGDQVAAVMLEPIAGNMGLIPPEPGYLDGLRELTQTHGALLIFDEVMTGFRVAWGGAQTLFGFEPDLTCLGKVIGGGLPVGAVGGRADLMEKLAPLGPVYQAGTLSGNPLAMTAGLTTLRLLSRPGVHADLEVKSAAVERAMRDAAEKSDATITLNRVGSMIGLFFHPGPVRDFRDVEAADTARFAGFFNACLERGVALAPSAFETLFVSLAHDDDAIARSAAVFDEAMASIH